MHFTSIYAHTVTSHTYHTNLAEDSYELILAHIYIKLLCDLH